MYLVNKIITNDKLTHSFASLDSQTEEHILMSKQSNVGHLATLDLDLKNNNKNKLSFLRLTKMRVSKY